MSAHESKLPAVPRAIPGVGEPSLLTGRYTTSFGLVERLPRLKTGFDVVAVLDLIAIALFISLLFTRFVVAPGVRVSLPETDLRMPQNASNVAVLTIGNKGMLFFDGGVYDLKSIDQAFERFMVATDGSASVVLLKTEASISLQIFLELCQMAQDAGFEQVQISGQRNEQLPDPIGGNRVPGSLAFP
jgi:biopolymer transport protein ExbD